MTDKKVADADVAAKGKERAEQVGTKDGKGTPEDPIVIDEPKTPVEDTQSETAIGNGRRFGTKITDDSEADRLRGDNR
jgi:hypothetical protein